MIQQINLGRRVKQLREERGLTQEELAQQRGLSSAHVINVFEESLRDSPIKALLKWSAFFNLSLNQMLLIEDDIFKPLDLTFAPDDNFYTRLKAILQHRELSVTKLEDKTNLKKEVFCGYNHKNRRSFPRLKNLINFCNALQVTPNVLLGFESRRDDPTN